MAGVLLAPPGKSHYEEGKLKGRGNVDPGGSACPLGPRGPSIPLSVPKKYHPQFQTAITLKF